MKSCYIVPFTRFLLTMLLVFGFGCSDDDPPLPCSGDQPSSSYSAGDLINYVLRPASDGSPDKASLPYRVATLRQAAPSEENDSVYWQWYDRTLTTTCAVTEYRRNEDGSVFLSWDFSGADCQANPGVTSGQLVLFVREQAHALTVEIRVKEFTTEQYCLTGTYQSVWRIPHSSAVETRYETLTESNTIITKGK